MLSIPVIFLSIAISVIDFKTHRIPNRLTLSLGFFLLFDLTPAAPHSTFFAIVATFIISAFGKFGAGDVKLFIVLLLTMGALILSFRYFLGMALVSILTLLVNLVSFKGRPSHVAFAPSILLPFLGLYLAI